MKKLVYILLLAVLLLQSGGLVVLYRIRQMSIKYTMMQELKQEEKNLEKLVLTLSDFEKCRINGHEIRYHGNMYDIKSSHITGENITLTVINDKKEAKILKKLKHLAENDHESSNRLPDKLIKFMSLTYVFPENNSETFLTFGVISFGQKSENEYSFLADILSPPPKLV